MHLEDEEIQRLLHEELAEPVRRSRLKHLGQCPACGARMERARREETEIFELLAPLDHPVPSVDPASLMRRATAPRREWRRKAAVIALLLGGAGVAYAAPGSPLPGWIRTIAASFAGSRPVAPTTAPAPRAGSTAATPSGIAVTPGRRLAIALRAEQTSGTMTVRITDGREVVVRATNGSAAFQTDVDRLTIANEESDADYDVEVPRSAPWVEILVAGRRLLLKHGAVVAPPIAPDGQGAYSLPLHR
jgi:hypothetical protein